jgi:phytoene dehydrogenase-like protein
MRYDAVVVGSGPNGLACAVTLAQAGRSVLLVEAKETVGGGTRTVELTLPGFRHDICSAIQPLGLGSPFFRSVPLDKFGLAWIQPDIPLAHPLDNGAAVALHRSIEATAHSIGADGARWRRLMAPLASDWEKLAPALLGPLPLPYHPIALSRFGLFAFPPATMLARLLFHEERARALFAGLAAHSILPLDKIVSSSFGLVLGMLGHAVGWPLAQGGSQQIANALAAYFQSLGGVLKTGHEITALDELPPAHAIVMDVSPRQLLHLAGDRLPPGYRRQLARYRYGLGVFKIDYALSGPVPWRAQECRMAGTVHLGATIEEIAHSEQAAWQGKHVEKPYVLAVQPSLFDSTRTPAGKHTLWTYCHVPNGSTVDMTLPIEKQIERFAPGFRDLILARRVHNTADLERYNPNYVGGDINNGVQDLGQMWTRPALRLNPYATPVKGLYLCSSATPPGGGVHGMCGYHAAQAVLRTHFA